MLHARFAPKRLLFALKRLLLRGVLHPKYYFFEFLTGKEKPDEHFLKTMKEAVKQEPIKKDDLRESAKGILADEPKPEVDNSKPGLHQLSLKTLDEIYETFTD
jgi:hypothetical protein